MFLMLGPYGTPPPLTTNGHAYGRPWPQEEILYDLFGLGNRMNNVFKWNWWYIKKQETELRKLNVFLKVVCIKVAFGNFALHYKFLTRSFKLMKICIIRKGILKGRQWLCWSLTKKITSFEKKITENTFLLFSFEIG